MRSLSTLLLTIRDRSTELFRLAPALGTACDAASQRNSMKRRDKSMKAVSWQYFRRRNSGELFSGTMRRMQHKLCRERHD